MEEKIKELLEIASIKFADAAEMVVRSDWDTAEGKLADSIQAASVALSLMRKLKNDDS